MSKSNPVEIQVAGDINPHTKSDSSLPLHYQAHRLLDHQHDVLRLDLNGSIYAAPDLVRKALAQEHPTILDIGTASGRWAMEMAREFPNAEVVGIDLVEPSLGSDTVVPANCRFVVEEADPSFDQYTNSFDLVHARMVDMGINDGQSFFYKIARMLKPGGVVLLSTALMQHFDENYNPRLAGLEDEQGFTWTQRFAGDVYSLYVKGGRPVHSVGKWTAWLEANPNFENLGSQERFIPVGPWLSDLNETEVRVANGMRDVVCSSFELYKPALIQAGVAEKEVNRMAEAAMQELVDLRVHNYMKAVYAWAVRTDAPLVDGPETPIPVDNMSGMNYSEALLNLRGLASS